MNVEFEIIENRLLKVGQKVRITKGLPYISTDLTGQIGIIRIVDSSDKEIPYKVEMPSNEIYWIEIDSVEPIEESSDIEKPPKSLRVGDTVRIKSREWYEANKDGHDNVPTMPLFIKDMAKYCGKWLTIKQVESYNGKPAYTLNGISGYTFSSEMFELPTDSPANHPSPKKSSIPLIEVTPTLEVDSTPIITEDITLIEDTQILTNLSTL